MRSLLVLILGLTAAFVLFPYGSHFVPAQPTGCMATAVYHASGIPSFLVQYDGGTGFDLNSCQRECRSRYGLEPYSDVEKQFRGGGRGSGSGNYYLYANCIAACNARFWREFDRKSDELEQER